MFYHVVTNDVELNLRDAPRSRSAETDDSSLYEPSLKSKLDLKVLIPICQILVSSGEISVNGNILLGGAHVSFLAVD